MYYVYILRCAGGVLYVGETQDLEWRVEKHNAGSACVFTRTRRPVTVAYTEIFRDRTAARARECQLKRWSRAKKEALIVRDLALLKQL